MNKMIYFEELSIGQKIKIGPISISEKEIIEFAKKYDPQPFHVDAEKAKEKEIEDRKDNRTKLQATQQSQMIDQRKNNSLPIDFEDDSGLNLEQFM